MVLRVLLLNKLEYWAPARLEPKVPSLVNLMVRRAAILPSELSQVGGFEFVTYPRLVAAGRLLYCPEAVVDHVRWFTFRTALATSFHGARAVTRPCPSDPGRASDAGAPFARRTGCSLWFRLPALAYDAQPSRHAAALLGHGSAGDGDRIGTRCRDAMGPHGWRRKQRRRG